MPPTEEEIKRMRTASGEVQSSDSLVAFLYLLARDDVPVGEIEKLLDQVTVYSVRDFTNGWLADWAKDAAARIRQGGLNREREFGAKGCQPF